MSDNPESSDYFSGGLLSQIPPTDPAILQRMAEEHIEGKHFAAIGRVAVVWAFLEAEIDLECADLADFSIQKAACFTSQVIGPARKLDAYVSLARLYDLPSDLITKLNKFHESARSLGEQRNRVIHDPWLFDHPNDPKRYEVTARKKLKFEPVPTSTDDLLKLVVQIRNLRLEFLTLSETVQNCKKAQQTALLGKALLDTPP